MGFFNNRLYEHETDEELQALLKGLVYKVLAQQFISSSESQKYEQIISELTRRNVEPILVLKPKDE